jgi:DNA/RNA endonuclease YhcR with UshA esterase domain
VANASYGNVYIKDYSGEAYVYGIGAKGDFEKAGLKVGDVVTLVGKRGEYKGAAQMTGAQLEKSNKVTEVSIADFLAKEDNNSVYYMVSGTIDEIANDTYGNLYITDGTNRLYVYGCYPGWGATGDARKGAIAAYGIKVGNKLTVIGPKSTYKGTPQVNGGIYFSHE